MSKIPPAQPLHDKWLDILRSCQIRLHTKLQRWRFASWGLRSCLEYPAKLMNPRLIEIGNNVHICADAWLNAKDDLCDGHSTLHIGDDTYIGRMVQINAWRSVDIGNKVMIADRVFISDADHNYIDPNIPIKDQGDSFSGAVTLQDGCWIGIGVVILPGVTIGRNAIVSANAVVMQDVPANSVVGGIPARVIFLKPNHQNF
jgi:acetyltransferase-like isoleucine patch superfamily enzyme